MSKKKDKTKKNGITVLIGLIVVAIIVIAVRLSCFTIIFVS
mgnify:CR=1 FL=1